MQKTLKTAEQISHEFELVTTIVERLKKLLMEMLKNFTKEEVNELVIDFAAEFGSGWELSQVPGIKIIGEIEYKNINLQVVVPSTLGHAGKLVFAQIKDQYVIFLLGRVHSYEGYEPYEVVRMVRAIGLLGVKRFIFTNAAGGITEHLRVGTLMYITDHLPGLPSPLIGAVGEFGPRHVPQGNVYSDDMYRRFNSAHKQIFKHEINHGVYASVPGPEFETPAQVIKIKKDGADAVGMSTTQQVTAIAQLNSRPGVQQIEVAAISLITNVAENGKGEISHSEVLEVGKRAAKDGLKLIVKMIASYKKPKQKK